MAKKEIEECISYGMPAFRVNGQIVCGFASLKNHCSYYPWSGSTLTTLKTDVAKYDQTPGTLRFAPNKYLPASLVKKLIKTLLKEIATKASEKDVKLDTTSFANIFI